MTANKQPGKVFLVGAGPGDPGLMTVKGKKLLRDADLVLYDGLANPLLLRWTEGRCERTARTKVGDGRIVPQQEINARLIAAAKAGLMVVRLKGGDPFIFGRGSEEALALHDAGIPFEVVPGITAATAAAEYAGFSYTHRNISSAVAFVTGHEDPTKAESHLDYAALAAFPGTLVFYMGLGRVALICEQLIQSGRSPQTSAAVVCKASTAYQQVVTSNLADLPGAVAASDVKPPSLIVVGDCVDLRKSESWFERQSLFGQTIVVTRPFHQATEALDQIVRLGGQPVALPLLDIKPVSKADRDESLRQLKSLADCDWIVFTSRNGVHHFQTLLLESGRDWRTIGHCKVAVVGQATAHYLSQQGITADVVPHDHSSEGLVKELGSSVRDKTVFWVKADRGREILAQQLASAGADVVSITVYRNVDASDVDSSILKNVSSGAADWMCFGSPAMTTVLADLVRDDRLTIPSSLKFAAISPLTAKAAEESGFRVSCVPQIATWEAMIDAIATVKADSSPGDGD